MPNAINIQTEFAYRADTLTHQARVVADGGTIENLRDLDSKLKTLSELGLSANIELGLLAGGGYKLNAGLYDKVYDWSGNSRDGTGSGATKPTYLATERAGKPAIKFSTAAVLLSTASYSISNANNGITLIGRVKMDASVGTGQSVFKHALDSTSSGFIRIYTSGNNFDVRYTNGVGIQSTVAGNNFWGSGNFNSIWVHYAFTLNYTTGAYVTYRNGIQQGSGTYSNPIFPANGITTLGSETPVGGIANGSMDDIMVFNKALSASQIGRLYNEI